MIDHGEKLRPVLEMCLASVVYQMRIETRTGFFHNDFDTESTAEPIVPADHCIRGNPLFKDQNILNPLLRLVRCGYVDERAVEGATPTGIPPHITQLRLAMSSAKDMAVIKEAITKLPEELGDSLKQKLDEFAQAQGNITVDSLKMMFQTHMTKIENMLMTQPMACTDATTNSESATPSVKNGMFVWKDGRSYALPEDYVLQKGTLKDALTNWYTADTVARRAKDQTVIPPLRLVQRRDFKKTEHKGKFSRVLKPLARHLEILLTRDHPDLVQPEVWNKQPNRSLTNDQFTVLWEKTRAYFPATTAKGYKRSRPADMSMAYAVKFLRRLALSHN